MSEPDQTSSTPKSAEPSLREVLNSVSTTLRRLGPASFLALATAILPLVGLVSLIFYGESLGLWLREQHTTGMAIYLAGFIVLSGLALVPTHASAILGGWAFGFATGLPLALAGFVGGSIVSYAVARPTASSRVESLIAEKPKWKAVHDALVRGSPWRVLAIVTLVRIPATAFAATNLVLASVRVPIHLYIIGTLVGMFPRTLIVIAVAAKASDLAKAKATPTWAYVVGAAVTVGVLWVLGMIANKAIAKVTSSPQTPSGT